jgi:ABC-type transporter Mla MlaB component
VDAFGSELVAGLAADATPDLPDPELDLTSLRFIDAAGVRAIAQAVRAVGESSSRVRIRGAVGMFRTLWELLECDRAVSVEFVA